METTVHMSGREDLDSADRIRHMLRNAGFGGEWNVVPSAHGSTGRAFVARRGDETLFVKLGSVHPALDRLSELGVTPPILARSDHDGTEFTVSRYIQGMMADRAWISRHVDALVDLFNVIQRDRPLRALLGSASPVATLDEHLATVVTRLIAQVEHASAPVFHSPDIEAALERLRFTRSRDGEVPLVPVHTDPNPANVLVTPERTYLVDWDGIRLSDPMRDIGLLLWWFVPVEEWPPTLRRFWLPRAASATAIDRVFWWSAVTSLRAALWIDRHAPDEGAITSFLGDFREAEARHPNPKHTTS